MCTPTILIGMAIGGGIGYATTGSVKGAVIGAALGGFGGYAVGAAGGVASGAGGALLGPPASATASGGFFSTLTSPGASLGFQAVGFGVNMIGQLQAGDARATEFAYRQAALKNQQIVLRQDIKAETETERLRQRLISQEGAQRRGDIRVAQAALGQLVDVGSAADITEDLAGEVAFKKLISQRESDLHKRNLTIEASSLETDRSLLGVQASADRRATRINQFGTALTTASTLSRRFRVSSGSLAFRT